MKINLKWATLQHDLFIPEVNSGNLGKALRADNKVKPIELYFDSALGFLVVIYKGATALVPTTNIIAMAPMQDLVEAAKKVK